MDETPLIQARLNAAPATGIVQLEPRIYTLGSLLEVPGNCILQGAGALTRLVLAAGVPIRIKNQQNVTLRDLTVNARTHGLDNSAIYIENSTNVLVDNIVLEEAGGFGIHLATTLAARSKHIVIANSYLTGLGRNDVIGGGTANSTGAVIEDVRVYGCTIIQDCTNSDYDNGMDLVRVHRVSVQNNTFQSRIQFGAEQFPNAFSSISGNFVSPAINRPYSAIILTVNPQSTLPANHLQVTGNVITQGSIKAVGTSAQPITGLVVSDNIIQSTKIQNGIELQHCRDVIVRGNLITEAGRAIQLGTSTNILVDGNLGSGNLQTMQGGSGITLGQNKL